MIDRPAYTKKVLAYADTPFVKILTGIRRLTKYVKQKQEEVTPASPCFAILY